MSIHSIPKLPAVLLALAGVLGLTFTSLPALAAYPDPPGGWTYKYLGNQLIVGAENSGATSLDGTWTHDNGSDAYDGSIIGGTFSTGGFGVGNGPGGTSLLTNSGAGFLRLQDCGDPRDYGYPDQSNRKVYFGHDIGTDTPAIGPTIMDTGVTLTFRARIPTLAKAGQPLDPIMRDGRNAIEGQQAYPTNGDGYVTSDGGKGNFVVRQGGNGADVPAGAIAFSFTQTTDTTGGSPTNPAPAGFAGLTFNEFNGNVPTANVNFGQGSRTNVVAFDPTDWHEIYIVIRKDPANIGTHEAFIFRDDGLLPVVFKITAGTGADLPNSFLAMGGSATPQNWALDVDWFGYKDEAVFPPGALLPPSLFGFLPPDRTTFHPITSNVSFSVSALMPTNRLPASGIKMFLNGQDVSSQLVLTGTDQSASRKATFTGLQPNREYAVTYIVTDSGGLSSTNDVTFDTFIEGTATILEAEDYNYGGGLFFDDPPPGQYTGQQGTPGVDFADDTPASFGTYRTADAVDTAVTADSPRTKFVTSGLADNQIATIGGGDWVNYTRTLTNPAYHAWIRVASTAAQAVRLDRVTNPTQTNQTVQLLGTFQAPRTGTLNLFSYVQLTDIQGRPVAIPGGGVNTLRLTAINANNDLALNFLLLQPVSGGAVGEPLVSISPIPGAVGVRADAAVEGTIYDGSNAVNQGSVKLRIGGNEVIASVAKSGGVTTVKHTPTTLWAPGTTFNVSLTYNDGTDHTNSWSFTTANYPVLTPAMKVTNATVPGFVWRMFQNEANQDATLVRAEDALAGRLKDGLGAPLPNLADPNVQGPASNPGTPTSPGNGTMTFAIPTTINVSQSGGTIVGNFAPDDQMPGTPGLTAGIDGIAAELRTFISLPRGLLTMGVNSDDGFRTTAGFLNNTPLVLGEFDGGRGAADSLFQFAVEEAGVYAFRTIYYEGGGDANLEWFMVNADGSRSLINDTANGGAAAFQQGTIPAAPAGNVIIAASVNASGQLVLQWSAGTLLSSTNVSGPYLPVPGATSPHVVNPADAQRKFFRVQVQ